MPPFPFSRSYSKQLMGDTVLQNVSSVHFEPIPAAGGGDGSCSSSNSSHSDDVLQPGRLGTRSGLMHSHSAPDASVGEIKFTVNVGQHLIKITGDCHVLVRMAKLVLDEYFSHSDSFASIEHEAAFGDTSSLSSVTMPPTSSSDGSEIGFKYNAFSINNLVEEDDEVFTEEETTETVSDSQNGLVRLRRSHFLRNKSQAEIQLSSENQEKEDETGSA